MEVQLKYTAQNHYPLGGLMLKGDKPYQWALQLQKMGISVDHNKVFPIPGQSPNSLWGCFLPLPDFTSTRMRELETEKAVWCQRVNAHLYLPKGCVLYPTLSSSDVKKWFNRGLHLFHPEFGYVLLEAAVDWAELLRIGAASELNWQQPADGNKVPETIVAAQIAPIAPEATMQKMEK
ncbi:MAG: hypothetical protein AAFO94_21605, partial [Bacteroidota bacterium]